MNKTDDNTELFSARYIHTQTSRTITINECMSMNVMVLNMSSRIHITTSSVHRRLLVPYSLATFPKGSNIEIECISETEILLMFFDHLDPQLRDVMYDYRRDNYEDMHVSEPFPHMKMGTALKSFATIIIDVYPDFLNNQDFLTTKFYELAFILIRMHPAEDVHSLLSPLFTDIDPDFRKVVIENYSPSQNVKTLAESCGYSVKAFMLKFRTMFGDSPGEWIKEQQRQTAERLLTMSNLSLQSIADEMGMSSQQQLTRFCKREFGSTPSEIVKTGKIEKKH